LDITLLLSVQPDPMPRAQTMHERITNTALTPHEQVTNISRMWFEPKRWLFRLSNYCRLQSLFI